MMPVYEHFRDDFDDQSTKSLDSLQAFASSSRRGSMTLSELSHQTDELPGGLHELAGIGKNEALLDRRKYLDQEIPSYRSAQSEAQTDTHCGVPSWLEVVYTPGECHASHARIRPTEPKHLSRKQKAVGLLFVALVTITVATVAVIVIGLAARNRHDSLLWIQGGLMCLVVQAMALMVVMECTLLEMIVTTILIFMFMWSFGFLVLREGGMRF